MASIGDIYVARFDGNSWGELLGKLQINAAGTTLTFNGATSLIYYSFTDTSNYQRLSLSATASSIVIAAETAGTGADNINVHIQTAGNGYFSLDVPDATATGGNARGTESVDLQHLRDAADQVASGAAAFCAGYGNKASGSISTATGWLNVASGAYSFTSGRSNTSSGDHSFTANFSNMASGNFSGAMGRASTASADYAFAHGYAASATHSGAFCLADGSSTGVSSSSTNKFHAFFTNGYQFTGGNFGIGTTSPNSTLEVDGGFGADIVIKTASYVATSSDYTILCDATSGNITITLPTAASSTRRIYNIKKIDSSANTVTIDADGSEQIDGVLTQVITTQYTSLTIQSNGTAWWII